MLAAKVASRFAGPAMSTASKAVAPKLDDLSATFSAPLKVPMFSKEHFPREGYGFPKLHQKHAIDYSKQFGAIDLQGQGLKQAKHDVGHVLSFDYTRDKVVKAANNDRGSLALLVRGLTTTAATEAQRSDITEEHRAQLLAHNKRVRRSYLALAKHLKSENPSHETTQQLSEDVLEAASNHIVNTRTLTGKSDNISTRDRVHPVLKPRTQGAPLEFEHPSVRALKESGHSVWSRFNEATQAWHISTQHGPGPTEDEFRAMGFGDTPIMRQLRKLGIPPTSAPDLPPSSDHRN